eukprot:s4229_g9.t1
MQYSLGTPSATAPPNAESSKPDGPVGLQQSISKLQNAFADSKVLTKAASPLKRPAAAESSMQAMAASPLRRPAAVESSKPTSKKATVKKNAMKRPAASSGASSSFEPGPVPSGYGKKMPSKEKRMELYPKGCSRCRFVPGNTPSCWVKKGWKR